MTASLHTLKAGRDAGLYYINDPNRERAALRRDEYYAADGGGVWWSTGETIVRNGAPIDKGSFRDLCAGYHPVHGGAVVRAAGEGHRAGWDVTLTSCKTISILWAFGNEAQRALIERIQREAVDQALILLTREVLVEVRLGAGGQDRQVATDLIVGRFDHFTSREGDPNVHTHNVIMNAAGCADGKWRTLEPKKLFDAQTLVGSAFRAALAEKLVAEGFRLRPAGRGQFEIEGFPDDLIETFSKRSAQIEAVADRSKSSAQKEMAALSTRQAKSEVPRREELERRWHDELAGFSLDPWSIALAPDKDTLPSRYTDPDHEVAQDFDPPEIAGSGPVAVAASRLFRTQSVITRTALLRSAFVEASLKGIGIEAVYEEISHMENKDTLVRLEDEEMGHKPDRARGAFWTTPDIAACEAQMLRAASRPNEREWISPAALQEALEAAPFLSAEQREAIAFASNRDGVCILEAGAGTGKTTLARVLTQAASQSGLQVIALAPSWVAADEIAASIGVPARAIAKWRDDQHKGRGPALNRDTILVVDESGMVGTRDMSAILAAADEYQCKVVILGDRRQLQAVQGANALGAIHDVLERQASLTEVRRQTIPWQRAASTIMARGDCEAGVRAYARNDRIELVEGEQTAQARVIEAWSAFREKYGDDTLIMTRRNADATTLNLAARAALRAKGRLMSADIVVSTIDRKKNATALPVTNGDRIRFGETLPAFSIRNGTRAVISDIIRTDDGKVQVTFQLDDGRVVSDQWTAFARSRIGRPPTSPRISHAYAGTAYAAQGRTVKAAVLYVAQATDARELYVGLTRHTQDARVIVERGRLDAAVRNKQIDPRLPASDVAILERMFVESRRYAEKFNVVDFVDDRGVFISGGLVAKPAPETLLEVKRASRSVRLIALVQEELLRIPSMYTIARLLASAVRTKTRIFIHPIETRLHELLRLAPVEQSVSQTQDGPDYGR